MHLPHLLLIFNLKLATTTAIAKMPILAVTSTTTTTAITYASTTTETIAIGTDSSFHLRIDVTARH